MEKHVSFFDAIESNKRNSIILMGALFVIYMAMIAAFSYIFDIGYCGIVLGFFVIFFYFAISYFYGDSIILSISGAKKIEAKDDPFLYNVAEGLALASGIPVPHLYIINDPAPNAFATGRDPKHASVAVTTGLRQMLTREELEGVVAHEISHIGNYDIRFSMVAIVFAGAIALMADFAWRMMFFGGSDRNRNRGSGAITLIAIAIMVLGPLFAQIVRFAISREREYLADATAAKLTRYPAGLASALEKITSQPMTVQRATDTTASLYIANPLPKAFALFSTHPAPSDRIKRLRAM